MSRNLFNSVKLTKPKTALHDLTHDVKFSCNPGELVPVCCIPCLPSDRFHISAESLIRFAPMTAPIMHRLDATIHYFFVPNRILWSNWEKFITNTPITPGGTDIPAFPTVGYGALDRDDPLQGRVQRLANALGLPLYDVSYPTQEPVNALPFWAYYKIWYEYYRDQNVQDFDFIECNDGDNGDLGAGAPGDIRLRNRAWEHDYFTGALPFAQKGPSVDIPLGKVKLDPDVHDIQQIRIPADHSLAATGALSNQAGTFEVNGVTPVNLDPNGTFIVDATTINDLRRAFKLQEWFERNARGGTRYFEHILAHFGIRSPDARLQRPEYICGIKTPVQISEVLNTTGEDGGLPQGNMAGHGIAAAGGQGSSYFCQEHGYIIGIMSVMPKTGYYQGIPKDFKKINGFEEFGYPTFAHLGEQEVSTLELWAGQTSSPDNPSLFGYVPRYAEYKYMPNRVFGDFAKSLEFWHMARKFSETPNLNAEFITSNPRLDIFAVEDPLVDHLYCHVLNKVSAVRPLPKYGNPGL